MPKFLIATHWTNSKNSFLESIGKFESEVSAINIVYSVEQNHFFAPWDLAPLKLDKLGEKRLHEF